jgi:hypothetical protein
MGLAVSAAGPGAVGGGVAGRPGSGSGAKGASTAKSASTPKVDPANPRAQLYKDLDDMGL